MKKKKNTMFRNGYHVRKKNTRIQVIEQNESFQLIFQRYVGENKITARTCNIRGVAETVIFLNKETLDDLCYMYVQYKLEKVK
jgi:hypothetical protein